MNIGFTAVFMILIFFMYLSYLGFRVYIYFRIILKKKNTQEKVITSLKKNDLYNTVLASKMDDEIFEVLVDNKIKISGNFIEGKEPKLAVFAHGFNSNRWEMLPYAQWFFEKGWSLVFFDFRNCGLSSGRISSLGSLEVNDLDAVMQWIEQRIEKPKQTILLGKSLGAAASVAYSVKNCDRIDGLICDTLYSSALKELQNKLSGVLLPKKLIERIIADVVGWLKIYPGYNLTLFNPEYSLMRIDTPLLLIHADEDLEILPSMALKIFFNRKDIATTQLSIFGYAKSGKSLEVSRIKYLKNLENFVKLTSKSVKKNCSKLL